MKTVWEYSLKTEAACLLHDAHQISNGFFRKNGFLILPFRPSQVRSSNLVIFPDLEYCRIPHFWEKVAKLEINYFPLQIEPGLLEEVVKLLAQTELPPPNFRRTQHLWEKAQKQICLTIDRVMPEKKGWLKKVLIHPTRFGTNFSFGRIKKEVGEVEMYLKEDRGITTITEAILTSLTRDDVFQDLNGLWNESEAVVDWLITHSAFTSILKKYKDKRENFIPTLKILRGKEQTKLNRLSESFYQKLGIFTGNHAFSLNGLTPEFCRKPLENLTYKEKIILKTFIQKANTVISLEEIADQLEIPEEKFSLWALAKLIERLRRKLESNGISASHLQTIRGYGYFLKN